MAGLVVLLFAVCAIPRTRKAPKQRAPAAVTVVPATIERRDLPVYLDTIGTVTSLYTVSVTSEVDGTIETVRYAEGQLVQKGTPLIEIDSRPFAATLQQAQGVLQRDLAVLAQARLDLERYRTAWASNAIAKQVLDDQEHLVRQTEGTVMADRGAVENARIQLGNSRITSPITGRVGLRLVDPGNLVRAAATTPLVVITQVDPISVVFSISEDDLGTLWELPNHGDGAEVTAFDRSRTHALAVGALRTIDNQIDPTTGTVRVRAQFANADAKLFPNQFVNVRVLVRMVRSALTIPSSAVQRDGEKAFVYLLRDGRAHVVAVKLGAVVGERTQVTNLALGTTLANSNFDKLREGTPVAIESYQARPGGAR